MIGLGVGVVVVDDGVVVRVAGLGVGVAVCVIAVGVVGALLSLSANVSEAPKHHITLYNAPRYFPSQVDELAFNSEILTVENGEGGKRLDAFLAARIPMQSRSYFGGLCQMSMVLVGGKTAKKSVKVEEGQEVEVRFVISPELSIEGEDIPLDVREEVVLP